MDSSFGPLDAFAFVVFAVLIFVGVSSSSIWANFQVNSRTNGIIRRRRDQCHELGRDRDRRVAVAGGVHMGVHNAVRSEISKERPSAAWCGT